MNIVFLYLVAVDDNSGSMGGNRQKACANKSAHLIQKCINTNTKYMYALFGSEATLIRNCLPNQVRGHLDCSEGTYMKKLADAAILAATELLGDTTSSGKKRIIFVLNTDGEANDSVEAAKSFNERFQVLGQAYPDMTTPRTFVIGIGGGHDQTLLGAMSVGVSSYFNVSDGELESMMNIVDTVASEFVANFQITLSPSGTKMDVPLVDGKLVLNGLQVPLSDTMITFPDGSTLPLEFKKIAPTDRQFVSLKLQKIQKEVLQLVNQIKSFTGVESNKGNLLKMFTERKALLDLEFKELSSPFEQKETSEVSTLGNSLKALRAVGGTAKQCKELINDSLKKKTTGFNKEILTEISATSHAIKLCQSCLECLRLGSKITTELQRDCMEMLGAGGFKFWTGKKLEKLKARASKQINPDSVLDIFDKVEAYFQNSVSNCETSLVDSRTVECFWTMSSALELVAEQDVPILVGNIFKGARNLGFSSVNSCYVIERALIQGEISICLQPISFRAFLGILSQKQQISRGPEGNPLNTMLGFLPDFNSPHSVTIAKMLSPLLASQLVTTNFISTVGTTDFKNAMLIGLLCMTNSHVFSQASCDKLMVAFDSFYYSHFGTNFLKSVLERGIGFLKGATTTGDVPAFSLAIADQMLILAHQRVGVKASALLSNIKLTEKNNVFEESVSSADQLDTLKFWKKIFLRLARDEMSKLFAANEAAPGSDGDALRSKKQKDAVDFFNILSEGINTEDMAVPFLFQPEDYGVLCPPPSSQPLPQPLTSDEVEFDDYSEEDENDGNKETQIKEEEEEETTILLLPQQKSVFKFIQCALEKNQTLPPKENNESFVSPTCLNTFQGLFLLKFLKRLAPQIQFMLCCNNHLQHQKITANGGSFVSTNSLFGLLGFESDHENGWKYLFEQCLLALMYKENTAYNKDLEKPDSLLNVPELTVLTSVVQSFWNKREAERIKLEIQVEKARLKRLKQIYTRLLYQHPVNLGFPLRICSSAHLVQINKTVQSMFGFQIIPSVSPVDNAVTGMALNTFLCPGNIYFLQEVKSTKVCDAIYGSKTTRSKLFLENLHSTANKLFIESSIDSGDSTRFATFASLFFKAFKNVDDCSIPLKLFASMKISEELLRKVSDANLDTITAAVLSDYPESFHEKVLNFIPDEFLWQTRPGVFITTYFDPKNARKKMTEEEFLLYLQSFNPEVLLTEDEKRAAKLALDEPLSIVKEKKDDPNEGKTSEELIAEKKARHAEKRQRRLDR